MSESGGDIPNPVADQNPGQAFNIHQETSVLSTDQNPNQYVKEHSERPLEDYTLWFGDVITFKDLNDPNAERSVIVDVKEKSNLDFSVLHITKRNDGKDMVMVGAPSTQGVEQKFYIVDKWTIDQVKTALKNSFENDRNIARNDSNLSESEKEKRLNLIKLIEDRELKRIDVRAQKQSRLVTQEDIREGKRKKV